MQETTSRVPYACLMEPSCMAVTGISRDTTIHSSSAAHHAYFFAPPSYCLPIRFSLYILQIIMVYNVWSYAVICMELGLYPGCGCSAVVELPLHLGYTGMRREYAPLFCVLEGQGRMHSSGGVWNQQHVWACWNLCLYKYKVDGTSSNVVTGDHYYAKDGIPVWDILRLLSGLEPLDWSRSKSISGQQDDDWWK